MTKRPQDALIAYRWTISAIVVLSLAAAAVAIFSPIRPGPDGEADLARITGALGFIAAAVTGLIGVIGTFRPKAGDTPTTPNHPQPEEES